MRYILYAIFGFSCLTASESDSFSQDLRAALEKEIECFEIIAGYSHEEVCVYEYCRGRIDAYKDVLRFLEGDDE